MPVIVETGSNTFKYIEDGRASDSPANYTYVRADEWPQQLQYMLERDYDTTPAGGNALANPAPTSAGGAARGPQTQSRSSGSSRGSGRSSGGSQASSNSSRPLVEQSGGIMPNRMPTTPSSWLDLGQGGATGTAQAGTAQAGMAQPGMAQASYGPQPSRMPATPSSWLDYTPPEEVASPQYYPPGSHNAYVPNGHPAAMGGSPDPRFMPNGGLGPQTPMQKPVAVLAGNPSMASQAPVGQSLPRATYGAEPTLATFAPTAGGQIYPGSNGAQPIPQNWDLLEGRGDPTLSPGGPAYDPRIHADFRASLAGNPELDQRPVVRSFADFGGIQGGVSLNPYMIQQSPGMPSQTNNWYGDVTPTAVMPQRDRGNELGTGGFGFGDSMSGGSTARPVTIIQANGQVLTRDPVTGAWR